MKKFNLGDTVYFMSSNKIVKGEITYLQTIEQKRKNESFTSDGFILTGHPIYGLKEVKTTYSATHDNGDVTFDLTGDRLFSTMEEIIENLKSTSL